MSTEPLNRSDLDKLGAQIRLTAPCPHKFGAMASKFVAKIWGDGIAELRCKICNVWALSVQMDYADSAALTTAVVEACGETECGAPREAHSQVFQPNCHPKAGVHALYNNGHLLFGCGVCRDIVLNVQVAEAPYVAMGSVSP